MRTTLKEAVGRGAAVNGNGRAVCRRTASPHVTRYQQPPPAPQRHRRRSGGCSARDRSRVLVLVAGVAGGVPGSRTRAVATAPRARTTADREGGRRSSTSRCPDKPAIALVIGYDRRRGEGSAPSRSDTLMLLRADPQTNTISMLSFPRDLIVDDPLSGRTCVTATRSTRRTRLRRQGDARDGPSSSPGSRSTT